MDIHLLSGDSIVEPFKQTGIKGDFKVCRECFVDGNLQSDGLEEFWDKRAEYLNADDYEEKVKNEFISLYNLSDDADSVVNLWFERELFCQINMWFSIWLLRSTEAKFQIVYPILNDGDSQFKNWSELSVAEMGTSFEKRSKVIHDDVFLAVQLWEAFRDKDNEALAKLGDRKSHAFPALKEITEAIISIENRPKKIIQQIVAEGKKDFKEVFKDFIKREPIYGFGDLQVKKIYDEING